MVVDRLAPRARAARRSAALRRPSTTSPSTSSSRRVRPAGFARVSGRGPLLSSRTPLLAQRLAPRGPRPAARAEPLQLGEAGAEVIVPRRSRAARAPPRTDSRARAHSRAAAAGVALELEPERLGARRPPPSGSTKPARRRQSVSSPIAQRVAVLEREAERALGLAADELGLAGEPVRLGARSRDGRESLQLAGRPGELERLVERATTGRGRRGGRGAVPTTTSGVIRLVAAARGASTARRARLRRRRPSALLELRPSLPACQVEQPGVQVAVEAVVDPGGEVAVGERVVALLERGGGQVRVRARDVLLEPGLEREREAAGELSAARRRAAA